MSVVAFTPLCTTADLRAFGTFEEVFQRLDDQQITKLMLAATRRIEGDIGRRVAPFAGLVESGRFSSVDPDQLSSGATLPLDLQGSLGMDQARAYGVTNLARNFYLREYAPRLQELWTSTIEQVVLRRFWGDFEVIPGAQIQGPELDTGFCRLSLGTFAPVGTIFEVTYSGGYNPVPDDLKMACILQAFKLGAIGLVPVMPKNMDLAVLDQELAQILGSYVRV